MRIVLWVLLSVLACAGAYGQGQFLFTNEGYAIDTRFRWGIEPPGFSIYGPGAYVEFAAGPAGGVLQRIDTATDFQTNDVSKWGYVNPVLITVPGVGPGEYADVQAKVFGPWTDGGLVHPGPTLTFTVRLGGAGVSPIPRAPFDTISPGHFVGCHDCQGVPPFIGFRRLGNALLIWWSKGLLQSSSGLGTPPITHTNVSNPYIQEFSQGPAAVFFWVKLGFAPASIAGLEFTLSPNQGVSPFGFPGTFGLTAYHETYGITASPLDVGSSGGSYSYLSTGDRSATLNLRDEIGGAITIHLVFGDKKSGTFNMISQEGEQSGDFVMKCRSDACLSLGL